MSPCCSPTRFENPASAQLSARLQGLSRQLGVADPMQSGAGELLRRTFVRPADDPAYRTNRLQPGALPLEWSFSEADPGALRMEFQPFDPALEAAQRLRCAAKALSPLVEAHYGRPMAAEFGAMAQAACAAGRPLLFGAFIGLVHRPDPFPEFKIYVELDPQNEVPGDGDRPDIAGAAPHFRSVAAGARGLAQRTYYLCGEGLRLLDLEGVCAALGMPHRFPALLVTVLELTGGEFYLPPRSVLLGIRRCGQDSELKVELVVGAAADSAGLAERIERLLQPQNAMPFRRWAKLAWPDACGGLPPSVVSVKVSARQSERLSVYAPEPWDRL